MAYIKVIYNKWVNDSLLYTIKKIKETMGWGLKDSKDYFDRIQDEMKNGYVVLDEEDGHFHLLKRFLCDDIIDFRLETLNTKKSVVSMIPTKNSTDENHRVISKRSKEYEKAKVWAESLHPNKKTMINLLIQQGDGLSR